MKKEFTPSLKQIYREIQKDIIKEINSCIPQTVFLLQENFINNIQTNDYFTLEEKQVISLYLKYHDSFTEENINKFSNGLLNEGLKDWIGNAWSKIKNVFSNIKDFVAKVWASIKKFIVEQCKKAYSWAKAKFKVLQPKIVSFIKKVKDKAQLAIEVSHIDNIYDWLKSNAYSFLEKYGKAAETALGGEGSAMAMKEMIFNSNFTRILAEATEEVPTDVTNPETISVWKKIGVAVGPLLKALSFVFNPLKALLSLLIKTATSQLLNSLAQFIQKLGGPGAIKYAILPGIMTEIAELMGAFHGADDLLKQALGLIPVVGPYIETILHVGHYIFIALAFYEIMHETAEGLKIQST
jgi:phage-related protein